MNITYVEFLFPGTFFSETTTREVDDRSPPTDIPKGCYGYRFFSQSKAEVNGEVLRGMPKDYSGTTYFGEVLTLDDIEKLPGTEILQSNMRINEWETIVRTIRGNYQPLYEGDKVIPGGRQ